MNVDLNEWRTRLTLEALQVLDEKWTAVIEAAAAKNDEDTAADYGNDLMLLMTLREELEELAVKAYGPGVMDFSGEPYTATTAIKVEPGSDPQLRSGAA